MAAFDVGLIPYLWNDYTRSCFPLKLYEYLAAGKPVVATGLPELAGMEPDVALVAGETPRPSTRSRPGWRRAAPATSARRQHVASRNTWESRTATLLGLVDAELAA